jgi:hypothetical protein
MGDYHKDSVRLILRFKEQLFGAIAEERAMWWRHEILRTVAASLTESLKPEEQS